MGYRTPQSGPLEITCQDYDGYQLETFQRKCAHGMDEKKGYHIREVLCGVVEVNKSKQYEVQNTRYEEKNLLPRTSYNHQSKLFKRITHSVELG